MTFKLVILMCVAIVSTVPAQVTRVMPAADPRREHGSWGDQWRECAAAPTTQCTIGRHVGNELTGFATPGAWLIRDSTAYAAFWDARPSRHDPPMARPAIDWRSEHLFVASIGGHSGCGPARVVNRIETHADTTVVVIGPDSGEWQQGLCAAYFETPDVVAIPAARGPVIVRRARPGVPTYEMAVHTLP